MAVKAGKFLTIPGGDTGLIVYADDERIATIKNPAYWLTAVSGRDLEARDFLEGFVGNYQRGGGVTRPVPCIVVGNNGMDMDAMFIDPSTGRIAFRGIAYSLKA